MSGLPDFYLSTVYGANIYGDRGALWRSLVDNMVVGVPWVIAGDFNIFKDPAHFQGGRLPENVAMEEFKNCIDALDVTELVGHGQDPVKVEGVIVQFYKDLFTSKGPLSKEQADVIRRTITTRVPVEDWAHHKAADGKNEGNIAWSHFSVSISFYSWEVFD
ncbi:hypothetical protein LIER_32502 [Lithospermum erythrorhizon]|uniref:Endonuclease/exonuclease/phosphatase domain-containing protein n=1 Tax=Lithospermum erythrorhizon TaxID=34254 RepID=A0AAV3RUY8_LITER